MQTCGNTSLPLKFSSDFLVSTKCELQSYIFAVESFVIHLLSVLSLRGVLTLAICLIVLSIFRSTCHCLKQFCKSVQFIFFFTVHVVLAVYYS